MTTFKGLLLAAGTYGGSVALSFLWLVIGTAIAGNSNGPRVGVGMMGTILAIGVTFLMGTGLVYRGLGRLGPSQGARLTGSVLYGLLAGATVVLLAFMTILGFNR
jgi:hypothetical protein